MAETPRQRGNDIGPTGLTVAENLKRIRTQIGMTQKDLSDELSRIGRKIPVSSIGKMEAGLRNVQVDDLMAIAVALDVSPLLLLLPDVRSEDDAINMTGARHGSNARRIWKWAIGIRRLNIDVYAEDSLRAQNAARFPTWLVPKDVNTRIRHLEDKYREKLYFLASRAEDEGPTPPSDIAYGIDVLSPIPPELSSENIQLEEWGELIDQAKKAVDKTYRSDITDAPEQ